MTAKSATLFASRTSPRMITAMRNDVRSLTAVVVLLLILVALAGAHKPAVYSQSKQQTESDNGAAAKVVSGWYRRPPGTGDYQEVIVFPDMERPSTLPNYLPSQRDLQAICRAQTSLYQDYFDENQRTLSELLALKLDELDPQVLRLPRVYQKLGDLSAYNGDMERSIRDLETSYRQVKDNFDLFSKGKEIKLFLEEQLGVAHMRLGELQNCQLNHNADMCIFPLNARAQHKLTAGSEKAIEYFKTYLETDPTNLEVRWLLNIAYMTLNKYPNGVPKDQLIPPSLFESREDIGRFPDVGPSVGINVVGNAGGTVVDDFDNDGFLDLVMSGSDPCETLHYYHNNGDGKFSDWTERARLSGQLGGLNLTQTDYNNDGWLDLFVMRGGWDYPVYNSLLKNNGDGTFTDVTTQSGLDYGPRRTHSVAWADFDNDGWLDVFLGHELESSRLFRNQADGTFEDVSAKAGVDRVAFTKGAVAGDYDNDGYPDLYLSNFGQDNFLYHNNRDGTFTDSARQLKVDKPLMSFTCWFFDYDNDGQLDIFVTSFMPSVTETVRGLMSLAPQAETMKLYRNTGKGTFQDVTKLVKLDRVVPTMGANFGDLDNDGYLDFYLGTGAPSYAALVPNFMFRNHDGRYFVDVTTSTGTGHLQKGHGVAFSDIDNDGDQDVAANIGGAAPGDKYNKPLFLNPGQGNNWLSLKLVGVKSNRSAIGAKIKVVVLNANGRESVRYRQVNSGGSFGASSLTQSIGLGKANRIKSVEVFWPTSNTRQVFSNLGLNQFIQITELEKNYQKRPLRSIDLGPKSTGTPHQHLPD